MNISETDAGTDGKYQFLVMITVMQNTVTDGFRHCHSVGFIIHRNNHAKFIATDAGGKSASFYMACHQLSDFDEHQITHFMAAGVIDQLELIKVDIYQCMALFTVIDFSSFSASSSVTSRKTMTVPDTLSFTRHCLMRASIMRISLLVFGNR